ncbi:hypothetical protein BFG51_17670 [Dietzia alimentaria]|nr:hypothetical protein BFG51_17670 [Dietzia alimentaria]
MRRRRATSVVPAHGAVRINLTLADPAGTTTKINAPGPELDSAAIDRARSTVKSSRWWMVRMHRPTALALMQSWAWTMSKPSG